VWIDASLFKFWALLEQFDDEGQGHSTAYASRQTNNADLLENIMLLIYIFFFLAILFYSPITPKIIPKYYQK